MKLIHRRKAAIFRALRLAQAMINSRGPGHPGWHPLGAKLHKVMSNNGLSMIDLGLATCIVDGVKTDNPDRIRRAFRDKRSKKLGINRRRTGGATQ